MTTTTTGFEEVLALCPAWVNWLAQDADGTWWGYEIEPLRHDTGWYENEIGQYIKLKKLTASSHWRQMCFPVKK